MTSLRVLVVEDRASDATLLLHELRRARFVPEWRRVETEAEYLAHLTPDLDLILADYRLPQFDGLRALELLLERGYDIPFIIVSGSIGEEIAVAAMRKGATDYLLKDRMARLGTAVTQALEQRRLRSERCQIEVALAENAALSQAVLRSLSARIAVLDERGVIIAVNDAWEQLAGEQKGLAPHGMGIGTNYLDMCRRASEDGPPAAADVLAGLQEVLVGRQQRFSLEYADRVSPEPRWSALLITPLRDHGGVVVAYEDITERKRLEAQYLQAQKIEGVGRLAGGIAHDFNNLLTAIIGNAELALLDLHKPAIVQSNLEEIVSITRRAATLTRQLLAFTRQQIVEPQNVYLNDLIAEISKLLLRLIGENITLTMVPTPDIGLIRADIGQIEQVLVNLAVNARDAMPGGGTLLIETANVYLDGGDAHQHNALPPGDYIMLAVSDTGTGMDDTVKRRAFEPFFTTKQPWLGTGLGLATCYEIVRQSGGHIQIDSVVGQGTTVRVYMPRVEGVATPPRIYESGNPLTQLHGIETILMVEDDPAVRSVTARVLWEHGYTVLEASNGDDALDIVHTRAGAPLDLLLLDVVMPRIDGFALADQIRTLRPSIRVLFMSGYTAHMALRPDWPPQGCELLQKPFSPRALAQKVRRVLDAMP